MQWLLRKKSCTPAKRASISYKPNYYSQRFILEGQPLNLTCTFWLRPSKKVFLKYFFFSKGKSAFCCLNCEQQHVTISYNWFYKLQFIKAEFCRLHPGPVRNLLINFHKSRRNRFTFKTQAIKLTSDAFLHYLFSKEISQLYIFYFFLKSNASTEFPLGRYNK